jgi:2-C-methyl-D-erythritol 4-phosphate cytidylyltransferase/2-C-methyl-D-erythritol 2,4-cyclodiphosphate synthase
MSASELAAAVIVAAGRGTRAAGATGLPKQYAALAGRTILAHTVAAFAAHPRIARVLVVRHADDLDLYEAAVGSTGPKLMPSVPGGETRQDSVRAGLEALATAGVGKVLIHDAARPFISADIIDRVLDALAGSPAAIAAEPVADTLKKADAAGNIAGTVDRAGLWRAQTPQGFAFAAALDLHRKAAEAGRHDFTDDAALAEWAGIAVALVPGSSRNTKITTREDLEMADRLMSDTAYEPRSGTGFDVHRFEPGDAVWLCGVKIPHVAKLEGHSDADVGLHALTDAVLGAIGDGDIGQHFPPSDPKWKGAASHQFLEDAARRVRERGGRIVNVDVTLLCEAPRVGPHRDAMRAAVAAMLGIDVSRVGVKATTTEGLGFTGRREGIAAMAAASVLLPVSE